MRVSHLEFAEDGDVPGYLLNSSYISVDLSLICWSTLESFPSLLLTCVPEDIIRPISFGMLKTRLLAIISVIGLLIKGD